MDGLDSIGARIRYIRNKAGKSQERLAEDLKCSRDTVRNWETGRVVPDNKRLRDVAEIFEVDWRWLLLGNILHMYGDEATKEILVDSSQILNQINPIKQERDFRNALFGIIGSWGIVGLELGRLDSIADKQHFYEFIKTGIISNTSLYMKYVNPLVRKGDKHESRPDENE